MRISVALCTYNGSRFLLEQLFSIDRQSRPPDELVLCDDGSTDETMAVVERFAVGAGFPVYIHRNEKNLGSTKNFEKAIGLCQGDVIVTADQDDVWYPDKLLMIERAFAEHDPGLVFSDADLIDGQGRPLHARLWPSVCFTSARLAAVRRGDAFMTLLRRAAVTGATMAFRADLHSLVLPIPDAWIHDEWIAILIAASHRIIAIEQPLIQYRRHEGNQVGVSGTSAADRAAASLATPRNFFQTKAERFLELRGAIARRVPERNELLVHVDGKIAHFQSRAALNGPRLSRVPSVFSELVQLRYTRYSGATTAFVRDLVSKY